jgi:hypothetical protein
VLSRELAGLLVLALSDDSAPPRGCSGDGNSYFLVRSRNLDVTAQEIRQAADDSFERRSSPQRRR